MRQELKAQITETQELLAAAIEADEPYEVVRHRARLQDLIDMASRHDVDVHAWVNQTLLHSGESPGSEPISGLSDQ